MGFIGHGHELLAYRSEAEVKPITSYRGQENPNRNARWITVLFQGVMKRQEPRLHKTSRAKASQARGCRGEPPASETKQLSFHQSFIIAVMTVCVSCVNRAKASQAPQAKGEQTKENRNSCSSTLNWVETTCAWSGVDCVESGNHGRENMEFIATAIS